MAAAILAFALAFLACDAAMDEDDDVDATEGGAVGAALAMVIKGRVGGKERQIDWPSYTRMTVFKCYATRATKCQFIHDITFHLAVAWMVRR